MRKLMLVVCGLAALGCEAAPDSKSFLPGPPPPPPAGYGDHFAANPPVSAPPAGEPAPPVAEDPPAEDPPATTPGDPPPPADPPADVMPMSDGQQWAVANFYGCSGTLIAPTWVLSAQHCGLSAWSQACFGVDPKNSNVCVYGKNHYAHPSGDIALLELSEDMTKKLPGIEPVPILTEDLDSSWIGTIVEAAGYGNQETGQMGEREFTAEPLVWLGWDTLTIDGEGKHGVCFGDSGGPVFAQASDGSVRVAGALSNGSDSCVGEDNFTRVDAYRDWIEGYTGPTQLPGPQPCGEVTVTGSCNANGDRATWCGLDDLLEIEQCGQGQVCSWSVADDGWRCIDAAADPCQGVTYWGDCNGNTLSWCDEGGLQTRECGACEETCVPNDGWGYWCVPSTCKDLLFTGECISSTTVRWCNREGEIETKDCSDSGQSCGWVDEDTGYWCQ